MSPSLSSGATCPVRPGQAAAQPQGDVHQGEEHRHLDQGSDHAGQCLSGGDPEDPDRTAMASSKSLLAAVKARVVVRG